MLQVLRALLERKVLLDRKDLKGMWALREQLGRRVRRVMSEHREQQAVRVRSVPRAQQEHRVLQVLRVHKAISDHKAQQEVKEPQDHRALKETLVVSHLNMCLTPIQHTLTLVQENLSSAT